METAKFLSDEFDHREFSRFRWAHARMNEILYGLFLAFALVLGLYRKYLTSVTESSFAEALVWGLIGVVLAACVPRTGFYLARRVVGHWYSHTFGRSYREYRVIEKFVITESRKKGSWNG